MFSPAGTLTRELFKEEEPEWIITKPDMGDGWSSCLQTLEGHSNWVNSVAFSHDSKHLASASYDKTVKLWDTATGSCLQTLEGHSSWVNSVAFSHDSKHLASAWDDKTVKLWDTATGSCFQTLTIGKILHSMSLDLIGSYLHTEIGAIVLNAPLAQNTAQSEKPRYKGYGLSSDGIWITWNSDNLLWLPSEYRPLYSAVATSTVAIGCRTGRVLIFNLAESPF